MSISVQNIGKRFGSYTALEKISLNVESGELLALLGPSGSGKTTLLRILAGLEKPDEGQILLANVDVTKEPVRERQVGFVFQHYALFRHLTIFENIAFGMRVLPRKQRPSETAIRSRVLELLELIQLSWVAQRFPHELSGGQRQRVALARALAVQPKVLLLDEPFGALDAKVRQELRAWLRRLHDEIHITSVFVTHDQEEALEVSDRVVILEKGRIAQIGSPVDVYHDALNPFVYEFIGSANRFHGRSLELVVRHSETVQFARGANLGRAELGFVRPHDFKVTAPGEGLRFTLCSARPLGQQVWLDVHQSEVNDNIRVQLSWREWKELAVANGDDLWLRPRHIHLFTNTSESGAWLGEGSHI